MFWYRFPVTPYNALPLSAYREEIFEAAGLATAADAGRYLSLLNDYAALAAVALACTRHRQPAWSGSSRPIPTG